MHHRLHTRFNVPRTELIPADQFEAACNFIGSYAVEGEFIPRQSSIVPEKIGLLERYMVSATADGAPEIKPIPYGAWVMTPRDLIAAIAKPGEMLLSTPEMFELAAAVTENLRQRAVSLAVRRVA